MGVKRTKLFEELELAATYNKVGGGGGDLGRGGQAMGRGGQTYRQFGGCALGRPRAGA